MNKLISRRIDEAIQDPKKRVMRVDGGNTGAHQGSISIMMKK